MVSDRDHLHQLRRHSVHKAEGVFQEDITARSGAYSRPPLVELADAGYGVLKLREKPRGGIGIARGVPFQRPFRFHRGGEVESKLAFSHRDAGASRL